MTEREAKVFEFLKYSINQNHIPSVREICAKTNITSTASMHSILTSLEKKGLIEKDTQNARSIRIVGHAKTFQVPLLGVVQAGLPILAVENIERYIPFSPDLSAEGKEFFALTVKGDSMINAAILEGDIIICEQTECVTDGQIVVALINDEATVKRFYREKKGFRLRPENDDYDPIYTAELKILGKVVTVIRNY